MGDVSEPMLPSWRGVTGGGSPEDSPNEARMPRGARHFSEFSNVVLPIES